MSNKVETENVKIPQLWSLIEEIEKSLSYSSDMKSDISGKLQKISSYEEESIMDSKMCGKGEDKEPYTIEKD